MLDQNTVAPGTIWPLGSWTSACKAICDPSVTAGGALGVIAMVAAVPPEGGATASDPDPPHAIKPPAMSTMAAHLHAMRIKRESTPEASESFRSGIGPRTRSAREEAKRYFAQLDSITVG
jgi:hypothetical protein